MTDVIEVETHGTILRQSLVLHLDPTTDLDAVRAAATDAMRDADGVCSEPAPDAVLVDIVDGEVEIDCRFWTSSQRAAATAGRDAVLARLLRELAHRRIDLPVEEVRVDLRHDGALADGVASERDREAQP